MPKDEAEVIETTAIEVHEPEQHTQLNLFGASRPEEVIERASSVANALKEVIVRQGLVSRIQGKEHPNVEAWTLLGSMLGVFPVVVWVRPNETGNGYVARVEARLSDGSVIGAAEASCTRDERTWAKRDDYALRGMAQTRATSRAMRGPLGFVMTLAGYEALGDDELPGHDPEAAPVPATGDWGAQAAPPNAEPDLTELRNRVLAAYGSPRAALEVYRTMAPNDTRPFGKLDAEALTKLAQEVKA